jgi:hypothetical protein
MGGVLDLVQTRIGVETRSKLEQMYSAEEVKTALFQMHPSKAPGVDGFTAGFFQRHWDLLGTDIVAGVLEFINGGELIQSLNDTAIVLIPKVQNPQSITQFRPISLCTVLYKICAKVIANRMRPELEQIISQEQSAFVPGRLITDNALVAFECVHTMKRNKRGKKGMCALKLDMMKAYDRIEWPFLEAMLLRIGFPTAMVQLIMKCVRSVRFSVKVNGELQDQFQPTRGLRQGDPMSPSLFLLCAEGLSALLNYYNTGFVDRGIRVCNQAPWITHLLFADDSLIFIGATVQSAARLNEILNMYHQASGQLVNRAKSSVFFSPCTSDELRTAVKSELIICRSVQ